MYHTLTIDLEIVFILSFFALLWFAPPRFEFLRLASLGFAPSSNENINKSHILKFGSDAIGLVRGKSGKFYNRKSPQGRAIITARKLYEKRQRANPD
jgi:hypothetical protein